MSGLIVPHKGLVPRVDPTAFIAANATLVCDIEIAASASIDGARWRGLSNTYGPDVEERQAAE